MDSCTFLVLILHQSFFETEEEGEGSYREKHHEVQFYGFFGNEIYVLYLAMGFALLNAAVSVEGFDAQNVRDYGEVCHFLYKLFFPNRPVQTPNQIQFPTIPFKIVNHVIYVLCCLRVQVFLPQ